MPEKQKLKKRTIPTKYFVLLNGIKIKSLIELADALEDMPDEVFHSHTAFGNHFSSWIENVFGEKEIAESIQDKNKQEMRLELYKRIAKKLW